MVIYDSTQLQNVFQFSSFDGSVFRTQSNIWLLTLPAPILDEEKKLTLNFYFHTSLWCIKGFMKALTQPAITCSKLTIETLEQGMNYV